MFGVPDRSLLITREKPQLLPNPKRVLPSSVESASLPPANTRIPVMLLSGALSFPTATALPIGMDALPVHRGVQVR